MPVVFLLSQSALVSSGSEYLVLIEDIDIADLTVADFVVFDIV